MLHIPQVLDTAELVRAQALLDGAPWVDGKATAGVQAAPVKNNQQLPNDCDAAVGLRALVLAALDRHALFFSAALPCKLLPPMFNRYAGGTNHYGDHVDQAIRHGTGHGGAALRLRTDLSCTLFLSPPESYDGGELVIDSGSPAGQRIKLPAGDAVLYPGSSVHRVEPVTRGERLASFFWIQSLVRRDDQRALLFEMDMALMRLRQRHGEQDADLVRLTGSYHNLLRLWADT